MPGKRPRRKTGHHDIDYAANRCRRCGLTKSYVYRNGPPCLDATGGGPAGADREDVPYCLTPLGRAVVEKWRPYAIATAVRFARERHLRPDDAICEADLALVAIVAGHDPGRSEAVYGRLRSLLRLRLIDWVRADVRSRPGDGRRDDDGGAAYVDGRRSPSATADDRDEIDSLLGLVPEAAGILRARYMEGKSYPEIRRDSCPDITARGVKERVLRGLATIRAAAGVA